VAYLVLTAWVLLLGAWVLTNPPFAAPDEADHYIRAIGISQGHLIGRGDPTASVGADGRQIAWTRQAARVVTLPAGLDPRPFTCATGSGNLSAACLNTARLDRSEVSLVTTVGNYQPLPYLLPAAIMRAADSPPGALRLARAAGALAAFVLLAIALFALYDVADPVLSITGLLLAVTPMALFCAASLTGSGLEISGGIAFFSCLLRLARPGPVAHRWWAATAITGAALALSRSASPLWVAVAVAVLAAWCGRSVLGRWARAKTSWTVVGVLLVAVLLNRVWESRYGSYISTDTSSLHAGLVAGVHQWWRALPELVGKFGYINVKLPLILPISWFALILALLIAAARHGRRARRVLLILSVGALSFPVVFYALFTRPTGFGLQGRQLLPVLVVVPLLAGEIHYRRPRARTSAVSRLFVLLAPLGIALVQAAAWYVNAKRFAVGRTGPTWFFGHASWSPPLGWTPWGLIVLAAVACLEAASLHGRRLQRASTAAP
jgi:Predicted membrane protein (DUF2142)